MQNDDELKWVSSNVKKLNDAYEKMKDLQNLLYVFIDTYFKFSTVFSN
jgi:hypothetical protein